MKTARYILGIFGILVFTFSCASVPSPPSLDGPAQLEQLIPQSASVALVAELGDLSASPLFEVLRGIMEPEGISPEMFLEEMPMGFGFPLFDFERIAIALDPGSELPIILLELGPDYDFSEADEGEESIRVGNLVVMNPNEEVLQRARSIEAGNIPDLANWIVADSVADINRGSHGMAIHTNTRSFAPELMDWLGSHGSSMTMVQDGDTLFLSQYTETGNPELAQAYVKVGAATMELFSLISQRGPFPGIAPLLDMENSALPLNQYLMPNPMDDDYYSEDDYGASLREQEMTMIAGLIDSIVGQLLSLDLEPAMWSRGGLVAMTGAIPLDSWTDLLGALFEPLLLTSFTAPMGPPLESLEAPSEIIAPSFE